MAISQVITFGGSPDQLVWKYPDENITTTSQLIVDETHEALLVVNGNAADLFGPGSRTLSLPNIPLVNKITTIPTGGVNPFPCKVFYVNKVHHLDLLWGTQGAPIAVEDPDYQIFLHVMLHGNVAFSIGDTRKFLLKLVGFRKDFSTADVVDKFKGLISSHVKDCISKMMINGKVGFFQMNANLMEVSAVVRERLNEIFDEYGIIIQYFNIESIEVPEKDYAAVTKAKERRAGRIIEGYSWQEERQMDIAKTFAGNQGAMGEMGGMFGGMMGGAMMGTTMAEMMRGAMSTDRLPTQVPPADVRSVMGAQNVRDLMNGGGAPVQPPVQPPVAPDPGDATVLTTPPAGSFCPQCGSPVAPGARFCAQCGNPLARTCPGCGVSVDQNARFCAQCGTKLM